MAHFTRIFDGRDVPIENGVPQLDSDRKPQIGDTTTTEDGRTLQLTVQGWIKIQDAPCRCQRLFIHIYEILEDKKKMKH